MQFTPQQLSGAGKYAQSVRIGNWNEDIVLKEILCKAAENERALGLREADRNARVVQSQTTPVQLSNRSNELHFGDCIALNHVSSGGVVSCNAAEHIASTTYGIEEEHQLSAIPIDPHAQTVGEVDYRQLRSLLLVEKADGESDGSVVHYGEQVFITTLPELLKNGETGICQRPLYLTSVHEGLGFTMSQRVFAGSLSRNCGPQNVRWKILAVSSTQCSEAHEDEAVDLSQAVQLVHCATGKALFLNDKVVVYNDFGQESQLICANKQSSKRTHVVSKEFRGVRTGDHVNAVQEDNWWKIEAWGHHASEGSGTRAALTADNVMRALVHQLGEDGVALLVSLLKKIDRTGEGAILVQEFKWSVYRVGAAVSADELDCLLTAYTFGDTIGDNKGVNVRYFAQDMEGLVEVQKNGSDNAEEKE